MATTTTDPNTLAAQQQQLLSQQTGQQANIYLAPQTSGTGTTFTPSGTSTLADVQANAYTDAFNPAGTSTTGASPAQPTSVLDSLPQDLANSYKQTLQSMMSGQSYQANVSQNNEGFVRAANELRAKSAALAVGAAGQGNSLANQNATENTILGMASQNDLNNQIATEQSKQAGLGAANTLVGLQTQASQFGTTAGQEQQKINLSTLQNTQTQSWATYDKAVAAGDFTTAAAAYKAATGNTLDTSQLKTAQDYMNVKAGQDITQGNLSITALQDKIGADKYNAIQNMVNTGATIDQINAQYGAGTLSADQYNSMKASSDTTFRLTQLNTNTDLAKLGITSSETIAGMKISSDEKIAGMQITSAEHLASDENWLKQQGIDIQRASVEGYTDSTGNHIAGSAEIAAGELGLKATTVQQASDQLYGAVDASGVFRPGTMANMDAETQQKAAALYGTTDVNGNHIPGSLELQADQVDIQKQGLTLQDAALKGYIDSNGNYVKGSAQIEAEKAGATIDSLKGYTDANGNVIPGSLELAAKSFGLQSDTLAMQKDEIKQKYSLLSSEDKRAADALYGTDVTMPDGSTVHKAGTMDLQQSEIEIKKQGMTLEEAGMKGYTDADGNHVAGSLEIASGQFDLSGKTYQDQHNELFGYYNNDTGAWVNGKIDSMNAADKNAAYALYGDPDKGIQGSLELQNNQVFGALDNQRTQMSNDFYLESQKIGETARQFDITTGVQMDQFTATLAKDYAALSQSDREFLATHGLDEDKFNEAKSEYAQSLTLQDRQVKMQEVSADSAAYWDASKKLETYASTHLDADPSTDAGAQAVLSDWFKAQTGMDATSNPADFAAFSTTEWKAATDNRLTNPIDQSIYEINSSTELDATTKAQMIAVLKDSGPNVSFITNKDGSLTVQHTDANGVVTNGSFGATVTFDPTTSNAPASFTEAGGLWKASSGTTQTTSPLVLGDKLTLVNNATVQNSSTIIPKGNYTVIQTSTGALMLQGTDGTLYNYHSPTYRGPN